MSNLFLDELSPHVRYVQFIDIGPNIFDVKKRVIYDYELYLVTQGEICVHEKKESYRIQPGEIHFMSPMVEHSRTSNSEHLQYYSAHFDLVYYGDRNDFDAVRVYVANEGDIEKLKTRPKDKIKDVILPKKFKLKNVELTRLLFDNLWRYYTNESKAKPLILKKDMLELLTNIFEEMDFPQKQSAMPADNTLESVKSYIQRNSFGEINLKSVADLFGYSASNLRKLYRETFKISMQDEMIRCRINKAKQLLQYSEHKIVYIANTVGYNDPLYFHRIFKKYVGTSPSDYRAKLRETN